MKLSDFASESIYETRGRRHVYVCAAGVGLCIEDGVRVEFNERGDCRAASSPTGVAELDRYDLMRLLRPASVERREWLDRARERLGV